MAEFTFWWGLGAGVTSALLVLLRREQGRNYLAIAAALLRHIERLEQEACGFALDMGLRLGAAIECRLCQDTGRVPSSCPDPQCGDSTWDHECDLGGYDPCVCAPGRAIRERDRQNGAYQ